MTEINLRRLEQFLAVVDHGTVTAAAAELRIAQPALSRQLKVLQAELGLELFRHRGTRLELTPAGRSLLPVARALAARVDDARDAVRDIADGRVAKLQVAATPATIRAVLAPFTALLRPEEPLLVTQASGHFDIYEQLFREADLVVSAIAPRSGLATLRLATIPVRAYAAEGHPLAEGGPRRLSVAELAASRLAVAPPTSVSRRQLDEALRRFDLAYGEILECEDGDTLHGLAATGRAVAVTTEHPSRAILEVDRLVPLDLVDPDGGPLEISLLAAWLPEHHAAATIEALARRLREHIARI